MDDENTFDLFSNAARAYWKRAGLTDQELHVPWVEYCHDCKPSDVEAAFKLCKAESPSHPNWKSISAELKAKRRHGLAVGPGRAWHKHLDEYRRNNETDEEVWRTWLEERTRWITHSMCRDGTEGSVRLGPHGYSFKERPTGPCEKCKVNGEDCGLTELACRARRFPAEERKRWYDYLTKCGEPIPEYLNR